MFNINKRYDNKGERFKPNGFYKKLAVNKYVKKGLDYYLDPDKKWNEDRDLLFEYCNKEKKIPSGKIIYYGKRVGRWLGTQKGKINSTEDELYKKLAENPYVKESFDKYLEKKKK